MYCRECGNEVSEHNEICTNCGVRPLNGKNYCQSCGEETKPEQELCVNCGSRLLSAKGGGGGVAVSPGEDKPSALLNVVSFCFPIVGLILFIIWRQERPLSSKSVGIWALVGFFVVPLLIFLLVFGLFFLLGIFAESYYFYLSY